jgi:hypothetical protein
MPKVLKKKNPRRKITPAEKEHDALSAE